MLSEDSQRKSRSELQSLIIFVNKTKKHVKIKRTPRFRFRALVRTVINNLKWLTDESMVDEKVSSKQLKLTTLAKGLLRVPVEQRTGEEKEMLSKLMGHLQCFDRYPEEVRENLTAAATFAYYPPGRILVAEGHPSVAMYFVISGQANVSKMTFDPGIKKLKSVDVATLNAGDAFGEINILHDEPWPATVTTLSHIEILKVGKENFQTILEEFLGEQQREITKCLSQFSYFKDWNNRTIFECCILARVIQYDNNALIIGDNCGSVENSFFVISGSCQVIYHLQVEYIPRKHRTELRIVETAPTTEDDTFPSSDTMKDVERPKMKKIADHFVNGLIVHKMLENFITDLPLQEPQSSVKSMIEVQVQSYFFQIANLVPGACFGVGESLDKKFILSSSQPVTVLCIPKFFLKAHNLGNIWGRVREFLNHIYPSPKIVFNEFMINRKWKRSRMKYLESVIKLERPFTGLTSAEAPYYTRLTTDFENPAFRSINKIFIEKEKL